MEIIIYIYIDRPGSPYHLDALDALTDMRREEYVRSILALHFPLSLLEEASHVGLRIYNVNQVTANILDPNRYYDAVSSSPRGDVSKGGRSTSRRRRTTTSATANGAPSSAKLSVSGVLARGLLTDRYLSRPNLPGRMYLSSLERRHVSTSL